MDLQLKFMEMLKIFENFSVNKSEEEQEWSENQNVFISYLNLVHVVDGGVSNKRTAPFIQNIEDVNLSVDNENTWILLGGCFSTIGDFYHANECYNIALNLNPESSAALQGLTINNEQIDCNKLKEIFDIEPLSKKKIAAAFALGKNHDKNGDYDTAFHYFKTANELSKEFYKLEFDPEALRTEIDCLLNKQIYDSCGNESDLPIFIVGMPRSGTTLIEQILVSHSKIAGAGELFDISRIAIEFSNKINDQLIRLHSTVYLSKLYTIGGDAYHVVDKMPDNIFWLATVATLFPMAKIIFCHRDLRDISLSCYFQNFINFAWSCDLENALIRAKEVERIMTEWKKILPNPIYDISYENLVNNVEEESKKLFEFIGLNWEDNCLDFHKTERQILTASLWQVRQPLFDSLVGRWKNYRKYINGIL